MFIAKVKMVAAVAAAVIVTGTAVPVGIAVAQAAKKEAARPVAVSPLVANPAGVTIVPRDSDATVVFRELWGKGGPLVSRLGPLFPEWDRGVLEPLAGRLLVPAELRFMPIAARDLIEAVAAARNLKVAWTRDGKYVVFYAGATDTEIELVRKNLASSEPAVRQNAALRGGGMSDPRIVPLMAEAAQDNDASVAEAARVSLLRLGWRGVLSLDETAVLTWLKDGNHEDQDPFGDLYTVASDALRRIGEKKSWPAIKDALANPNATSRKRVLGVAWPMDLEEAVPLLEKALMDSDQSVRISVIMKLSCGGERTLPLLEKVFAEPDVELRRIVVYALGRPGGERARWWRKEVIGNHPISDKALAFLHKALADQDREVRKAAVLSLGEQLRGEKAVAQLAVALADPDAGIRKVAAYALSYMGDDAPLELIEKALSDSNSWVRADAIGAASRHLSLIEKAIDDSDALVRNQAVMMIGYIDGDRSLSLIERVLTHPDAGTRSAAVMALGRNAGGKALALIEKALTDPDFEVRSAAVRALGNIGGETALSLVKRTIAGPDSKMRLVAIATLGDGFRGKMVLDLLESALVDPDVRVRDSAVSALHLVGGNEVRDLLLRHLAKEQDVHMLKRVTGVLRQQNFPDDPAVAQALKEAEARVKK